MKSISVIKDGLTLRILAEIKERLTVLLGTSLKEIVLYGSYARNQQSEDSDIDIVVFLASGVRSITEIKKEITNIKVDLSLKYDVVISILVKEHQQYLDYRNIVPFYSNIYNEGIALYG